MDRRRLSLALLVLALVVGAGRSPAEETGIREYPVPSGSHPHDVAPAPDGSVWYTAQHAAALGRLEDVVPRMKVDRAQPQLVENEIFDGLDHAFRRA